MIGLMPREVGVWGLTSLTQECMLYIEIIYMIETRTRF